MRKPDYEYLNWLVESDTLELRDMASTLIELGNQLADALRRVKSDRPSVHSDDVWLTMLKALDEWDEWGIE